MELRLVDLSAGYGRRVVLRSVNLVIEGPGITLILGPNGSGKTTLLRSLIGVAKVLRGSILFDNRRVDRLSFAERAKIFSYVPQRDPLCELEVLEYVALGCIPRGTYGSRKCIEEVQRSLERLGIEYLANRRVSTLSGGEARLVSIARALTQSTPILLLDEPFESLDPSNRAKLCKVLKDLAREKIVLLTSHNVEFVFDLADHIVGIHRGKVVFSKYARDVNADDLFKLYNVEMRIMSVEGKRIIIPSLED